MVEKAMMVQIEIDPIMCKGCLLCVADCPRDVLVLSEKRGRTGYLLPQAQKPENCIFCHKCELICPEFAISVRRSKDET